MTEQKYALYFLFFELWDKYAMRIGRLAARSLLLTIGYITDVEFKMSIKFYLFLFIKVVKTVLEKDEFCQKYFSV